MAEVLEVVYGVALKVEDAGEKCSLEVAVVAWHLEPRIRVLAQSHQIRGVR